MTQLIALISSFRRDEGQGLAEYALILALIAIVAIVALIFLGGQVSASSARSATPSRSLDRQLRSSRPPAPSKARRPSSSPRCVHASTTPTGY